MFTGCNSTKNLSYLALSPKIDLHSNEKRLQKSIKVAVPFSSMYVDTQYIYYKNSHEVLPFRDSRWIETPLKVIHRTLIDTIKKSNRYDTVANLQSNIHSDLLLESSVNSFMYDLKNSQVILKMDLNLIDRTKMKVVKRLEVEMEEKVLDNSATGVAVAFENVLSQMSKRVQEWISVSQKEEQ